MIQLYNAFNLLRYLNANLVRPFCPAQNTYFSDALNYLFLVFAPDLLGSTRLSILFSVHIIVKFHIGLRTAGVKIK